MYIHPEQEYPYFAEWLRNEDHEFLRLLINRSGIKAVEEEYMLCLAHHVERQYEWSIN